MSLINKITIRVIAVFMTAILTSFIPDTFPEFFGDVKCQGNTLICEDPVSYYKPRHFSGCKLEFASSNSIEEHGPDVHWGGRHFLWMWMSIVLGVVQLIGIFVMIEKNNKDESK